MNKEEIMRNLKELNEEIKKRYKARIEGIFGSYARGEEISGSDLDVLVEFEEGANLFHLVGISLFLEEKLHIPVDIVPVDAIREELKGAILQEAMYL